MLSSKFKFQLLTIVCFAMTPLATLSAGSFKYTITKCEFFIDADNIKKPPLVAPYNALYSITIRQGNSEYRTTVSYHELFPILLEHRLGPDPKALTNFSFTLSENVSHSEAFDLLRVQSLHNGKYVRPEPKVLLDQAIEAFAHFDGRNFSPPDFSEFDRSTVAQTFNDALLQRNWFEEFRTRVYQQSGGRVTIFEGRSASSQLQRGTGIHYPGIAHTEEGSVEFVLSGSAPPFYCGNCVNPSMFSDVTCRNSFEK